MAESDTAADGLERKLATILSADVAAYSRLMAEDEERTLQTFRGHKEVFEKLVGLHRGRVFNTAGDAILAEFGSPVEAVRCATEIQAALRTRNDQLPSERQVNFRIGVNLGDVIVQGADLLGDGANVAARLQGVAEPGGICVSGSVYDQVLNKLSLSFKPLGQLNYKNLPQPVRTFAIARVAGLGVLPSPARRHQLVNGLRSRPFVIVALVLITIGGVSWFLLPNNPIRRNTPIRPDYRRRKSISGGLREKRAAWPEPTASSPMAMRWLRRRRDRSSRIPIKWAARPPPQRPVTIGAGSIAGRCATPPAARPSRPTASRRKGLCWAIG